MATSDINLSPEDALDFVRWMLSEIARRPPSWTKHQDQPFVAKHMSRQLPRGYQRGSDLSERLYVCVTALERAGYTNKESCVGVAELCDGLLGKSKRGRPRTDTKSRSFESNVQTVRTMVRKFGRRQHYPDSLMENWVGQFLYLQKVGVLYGSEYVPDSGQKMLEEWRESMRTLQRLKNLR